MVLQPKDHHYWFMNRPQQSLQARVWIICCCTYAGIPMLAYQTGYSNGHEGWRDLTGIFLCNRQNKKGQDKGCIPPYCRYSRRFIYQAATGGNSLFIWEKRYLICLLVQVHAFTGVCWMIKQAKIEALMRQEGSRTLRAETAYSEDRSIQDSGSTQD